MNRSARLGLLLTFGLMAGPFLSMLDSNIVNVAVPTIARQLHTTIATVQWTLSGYLLALGAMLAASPFLAKRFGTRPVYLASMAAFTGASLLCALAPSIGFLIAARILQGLAGAPLVPLAMSMLMGRSGAAQQMSPALGILLFVGPAAGPTVGGLLIPPFGWSSIFLINLPVGILGIIGALQIRGDLAAGRRAGASFDPIGLIMLAAGMALTLYGVSAGPSDGWTNIRSWPFWSLGLLLLITYVPWALRRKHPALDLKLLRQAQPALAVGISVVTSAVLFAALFLVPVFMQTLQGFSALQTGLALLPQGVVTGIATVLGNQLGKHFSVRASSIAGMLLLSAMTGGLLLLGVDTPAWVTALILAGRGIGMGLVIAPLVMTTLGRVERDEAADANTVFNVVQRLGGAFGIALLATFLQVREQAHVNGVLASVGLGGARLSTSSAGVAQIPPALRRQMASAALAGFHDTFLLLTAASLAGLLLTFFLRSSARVPLLGRRHADEVLATT